MIEVSLKETGALHVFVGSLLIFVSGFLMMLNFGKLQKNVAKKSF
jgi:hypothetical protein